MVAYYPDEFNINKIVKSYPELEMVDEVEEDRLAKIAERRRRGKGAPRKAKTEGMVFFFSFFLMQLVLIVPAFFFFKNR
jgi:hypothetical protein